MLATSLQLLLGCSSDDQDRSIESPVVKVEEEKERKPKKAIKKRSNRESGVMVECLYETAPEGTLAVSVILAGINPVLSLGSLLFYGGDFYLCKSGGVEDFYEQEKAEVLAMIRKEVSSELRADFQKIIMKLEEQSEDRYITLTKYAEKSRQWAKANAKSLKK